MAKMVKNLTKRELLLEYFTCVKQFKEDAKRTTTKYVCLVDPTSGKRYFIGKNGAVRVGETISSSISLTDKMNDTYLSSVMEKVQLYRDSHKSPK